MPRPDLPDFGWTLLGVEDRRRATHTCEFCGHELIRFVHILHHRAHGGLGAGYVCSARLTGDPSHAKMLERAARNEALRRRRSVSKWLAQNWGRDGPCFRKTIIKPPKAINILLRPVPEGWSYEVEVVCLEPRRRVEHVYRSQRAYARLDDAKLALWRATAAWR